MLDKSVMWKCVTVIIKALNFLILLISFPSHQTLSILPSSLLLCHIFWDLCSPFYYTLNNILNIDRVNIYFNPGLQDFTMKFYINLLNFCEFLIFPPFGLTSGILWTFLLNCMHFFTFYFYYCIFCVSCFVHFYYLIKLTVKLLVYFNLYL